MVSCSAEMLDEANKDDKELLQEELSPFPEVSKKEKQTRRRAVETRTFVDIDMANRFAMQDYSLSALEEAENTFVVVGDNGFPEYYRVEIRFIDTSYICCPTYFTNAFSFRRATEEEALPIRELMRDQVNVFCLERHRSYDVTRDGTRLEVKPFKCFIAARSVEITLYFGGDMES